MSAFIGLSKNALVISLALSLLSSTPSVVRQPQNALKPEQLPNNPANRLPVPMELLGQGARAPTAEEMEQEQLFDAQQIKLAGERLNSQDSHQRIVGVEQLNAYQYPEAEALLLKVLRQDPDATVRQAAVQSLGLYKTLSDRAVNQLLDTLSDRDPATGMAALDTVLNFTTRVTMDEQQFPKLLAKLKRKQKNTGLPKRIHAALTAFIVDQQPVCNPVLLPCSD